MDIYQVGFFLGRKQVHKMYVSAYTMVGAVNIATARCTLPANEKFNKIVVVKCSIIHEETK